MATGFGFCPTCGTALTTAAQTFCVSCGATLQPAAAAAGAVLPPNMPPSQPPLYAPAPPPNWAVQPAVGMAPPAAKGSSAPLLIGAVVIAAIVGVAIFAMSNGSKGLPGASGSAASSGSPVATVAPSTGTTYPGTLAFNPKTIGCPSQPFTTSIVLPGALKDTDEITYKVDDREVGTRTIAEFGMTKNAAGKWTLTQDTPDGSANCDMGPGLHTAQLLDSNGKVLAQTTFTFVMSATTAPKVTPTPASKGTVTIKPSSFSCSGAATDVVLAIRLSGSIPGSSSITGAVDGVAGTTSTVESGFEKQADGSWLSSATESSTSLCDQLSVGQHTLGALDADGNVIAQGTFTLKP